MYFIMLYLFLDNNRLVIIIVYLFIKVLPTSGLTVRQLQNMFLSQIYNTIIISRILYNNLRYSNKVIIAMYFISVYNTYSVIKTRIYNLRSNNDRQILKF